MAEETFDKTTAVKLLNQIMEAELAGVVRYTHYSLMIFGHNRIPIVSWLRNEANTCLAHANEAGELVAERGREKPRAHHQTDQFGRSDLRYRAQTHRTQTHLAANFEKVKTNEPPESDLSLRQRHRRRNH